MFVPALNAQELAPRLVCEPVLVGEDGPVMVPEYLRVEGVSQSVTIDVMLLYSPAALAENLHGDTLTPTMNELNRIYKDTGITFRVVGVYSMNDDSFLAQTAARVENDEVNNRELLLAVAADGGVLNVRTEVGADIVLTWLTNSRDGWVAGIAYQPTSRQEFNSPLGHAVIQVNSGGNSAAAVMAHEFGHNLGLHHPPAPRREGSPFVSYGQGYIGSHADLSQPYFTVMGTGAEVDEDHYWVSELSAEEFADYFGRRVRIGDSRHRGRDAAAYTASWVADYVATVKEPDGTPEPEPDPQPDPEPTTLSVCGGGTCVLEEGRFRVRVRYSATGSTETAQGLTGSDLTASAAMFRFGGERPELLVGVIDRCETDGYWSFYAGAATDTPYAILIRDTETNELNQYGTGLGSSIRDTQAFRCDQ
ncbi:MAG: M12 family metallo-peptidase [Acidobacteria bacterium]|nr:M12 family metallo-peptidase [Acidobacteriota bacterium]